MYHGDSETLQLPSYADVQAASERIAPLVHRTPVFHSRGLDERCGARVLLKCENLQRVGAFKFRGASNAVRLLSDEEAQRGVVTHSSGNHAQALALARPHARHPRLHRDAEDGSRREARGRARIRRSGHAL
jgi:threonine dehydratase